MISVRPSFDLPSIRLCAKNSSIVLYLPSQVGEGRKMQVAHHAQGGLLLRIVNQNGILGGYSIHNTIRKRKDGDICVLVGIGAAVVGGFMR